MKIQKSILYLLAALSMSGMIACTDVEPMEIDHVGGLNTDNSPKSEAYYANLREYKKTAENYGRPVYFGWFSGWAPEGAARQYYMENIPDSVDFISLWSSPFNLTPAKIRDKKIFQEKKGGKIFVVYILHEIGKGITPDEVFTKVEEENPDASSSELSALKKKAQDAYWGYTSGVKGSEDHIAAIHRYAEVLVDSLVKYGYDGLDIDWEPNIAGDGDGSLKGANGAYLHELVKTVGKYFGPMATERPGGKYYYMLLNGEITSASAESAPYFDYYTSQAYSDGYASSLEGRVGSVKRWAGDAYNTRKHIFTANFESYWEGGGNIMFLAKFLPADGPKGGVGAFRFENDYENIPDYKWTRMAIQINQQVYKEYLESLNNPENPEE